MHRCFQWEMDKHNDIVTYRDQRFRSTVTGNLAAELKPRWWEAYDDSLETFVKGK